MSLFGKVLIIDDEMSIRQTLARILHHAGLEATTAENGEQGLAYLESTSFDLVFLDVRMPGLAGLEVLEIIRVRYPGLPVVLFTAQPDLNSAVEALRHGATDYLVKPLKPEALIEKAKERKRFFSFANAAAFLMARKILSPSEALLLVAD